MNNYISLDQIGKRLDLKVNNLIMVNYVPYIVRTQENSVLIMAGILTEIPVYYSNIQNIYINQLPCFLKETQTFRQKGWSLVDSC